LINTRNTLRSLAVGFPLFYVKQVITRRIFTLSPLQSLINLLRWLSVVENLFLLRHFTVMFICGRKLRVVLKEIIATARFRFHNGRTISAPTIGQVLKTNINVLSLFVSANNAAPHRLQTVLPLLQDLRQPLHLQNHVLGLVKPTLYLL
jgi:hypothetical protein